LTDDETEAPDAATDEREALRLLEAVDPLLAAAAETAGSPWDRDEDGQLIYVANLDLLRDVLDVPIRFGEHKKQQGGKTAKAYDAWIAHELRCAGFPAGAVWPRPRTPRVLPNDLALFEAKLDKALEVLDRREAEHREATGKPRGYLRPVDLRHAVAALKNALPGSSAASILGRFYVKQVDVVVSAWQHGPDVLVSTKTMFSSYLKNKNNRYEEAVGEATNLRDRHPMAAMGFAYLVRTNIYEEAGAFAYIRDLLARLRKPDGPFDATMLLTAEWDDDEPTVKEVGDPSEQLTAGQFFADLVGTVLSNTPVTVHHGPRLLRDGTPDGGLPDDDLGT
jgi:hypothetical protein